MLFDYQELEENLEIILSNLTLQVSMQVQRIK